MTSLIFILLLALLAWFWYDSVRARESAVTAAARACNAIQAQLLDQTVSLTQLRASRGSDGRLGLRRRYEFELSHDRQQRSRGHVMLLSQHVYNVHLDNEDDGITIIQNDESHF